MKPHPSQTLIARAIRFLFGLVTLLVVTGAMQCGKAQAKWCGPESIVDACKDTLLLLQAEQEELDAQLMAAQTAGDEAKVNSLQSQLLAFGQTITALQQYILDWSGPCVIAEEELCPICNLALSQCSGHQEELCPICFVAISQCPGHQEQQCSVCYLPLSQCQGHEQLCGTCGMPLSQCSGHEQLCGTCGQPLSQCYCPLP